MSLSTVALILATISTNNKLPVGLLSALCFVESSHRPAAMNIDDNGSSSIGLCQIKLGTARLMGFQGTEDQLKTDPQVNATYAAKYLRKQIGRYKGDLRKAVASYNSGTYKASSLHPELPINQAYVAKVFKAWAEHR